MPDYVQSNTTTKNLDFRGFDPRMFLISVSAKKHSFDPRLGHAILRQKLPSSPRFGALKANIPMSCLFFEGGVFISQTPVGWAWACVNT